MMGQESEAFMGALEATIADAAMENKMSQLKTQIAPDGRNIKLVRLIIFPEYIEHDAVIGNEFTFKLLSAMEAAALRLEIGRVQIKLDFSDIKGLVGIIVIPEEMEYKAPIGASFGTPSG